MSIRYLYSFVVLSAVSLISGCTTVDQFVIANYTSDYLMVSYVTPAAFYSDGQLLNECFEKGLNTAYLPMTTEVSDFRASYSDWTALTPEQYLCDFQSFSIHVQIEPRSAVRVAYIASYSGENNYQDSNELLITNLTLEGRRGVVSYEGNQVSEVFHQGKANSYTYVIRYE